MKFDDNYFSRQKFTEEDTAGYRNSALRDFQIADKSRDIEVQLHFSYMALIKTGICKIAKEGYRVRSRPGHHVKIIEALSKIMKDDDILVIGDKMRKDRNMDFYEPEGIISDEDVEIFMGLVKKLIDKL